MLRKFLEQTFELGININHIVCASGSAGTHAGLLTGFYGNNSNIPATGISVNRKKDVQEEVVYNLVQKTAARVGIKSEIPKETVVVLMIMSVKVIRFPTDGMIEAVNLLAKTEGILLDPVYTGKAMAGLIDLVRKGYFKNDENVLFIHTGGSPALYAYLDTFLTALNNQLLRASAVIYRCPFI